MPTTPALTPQSDSMIRAAAGAVAMIAMVDAAMVEMKNITPPLRRSECERLIRAALAAAPTPAAAYAPLAIDEARDLTCMLAGAPWPDEMLPELQRLLSIYDGLRAHGQRPVDPATLPREAAKLVMETGLLPDTAQPVLIHPDDAAVDRFAAAMKAKLASARAKGRSGWEDKAQCQQESLALDLRKHVHKGDPVDVANFAMMLHQRGESTKLRPLSQDLVDAIKNAPVGASVIEHNGHPVFISRASEDAAPMLGLMESNHCELQAKVLGVGRAIGEILVKVVDGGMVPQDLQPGMVVDLLYTPASEEAPDARVR